jgi:hypothetical protein
VVDQFLGWKIDSREYAFRESLLTVLFIICIRSFGDSVRVDNKYLAFLEANEVLMVSSVVKHSERSISIFDVSILAIGFYESGGLCPAFAKTNVRFVVSRSP